MTFLQAATSTDDLSEYTFAGQNLGAESSTRSVIVAVGARDTTAATISGVTIGGVSATIVKQGTSQNIGEGGGASCVAGIAIATVPSGTSGDIVVTFNDTVLRCGISVYVANDLTSNTPHATASNAAVVPSASLDVPAGGVAIGCSFLGGPSGGLSCTWSNLTEDADTGVESAAWSSAHASFESAASPTITATWATTSSRLSPIGVFASWEVTPGGGSSFQAAWARGSNVVL